jgi:hypothetical protein
MTSDGFQDFVSSASALTASLVRLETSKTSHFATTALTLQYFEGSILYQVDG